MRTPGQPRDGKSWIAQGIALAATQGVDFCGRFKTTPCPALVCGNEDTEAITASRLKMLLAGQEAPDSLRLFIGRGLWLDDADWQQKLLHEVDQLDIGLVILDPLRSLTAAVDQGPAQLQPLALFLRKLMRKTGCGILCVHHDTKPSTMPAPDDRRHAQRVSGGGLFSIIDSPIHVQHVDDEKSLCVPDGFKHTETPAPFLIERSIAGNHAVLLVADAPTRDGNDLAVREEIKVFLKDNSNSSGSAVARGINRQKDVVLKALKGLEKAQEVRSQQKGKSTIWWVSK